MTSEPVGERNAPHVEQRTIDHIPVSERHGKARELFTIWFGSNIMLLTVATGVVATSAYGLSIGPALIALALGNVVGGVVMALHAAQGPRMGVPQMLQTRAQFGYLGSLLVVVLVIAMYVGFFASNMVLGGEALSTLSGLNDTLAIVVIGSISVIGAIFGYRIIHTLAGITAWVAGLVLVVAFVWALGVQGLPEATFSHGSFSWVGFMGTLSLSALWQIAYAPYVSDYTRYMPYETGARPAFWATYGGAVLGSLLPMILGALAGAAFSTMDTVPGLGAVTGAVGGLVIAVFAVGIAVTNAMNLYCGALSTITVGQTLVARLRPGAAARAAVAFVLFAFALVMSIAGKDNFLVMFTNFMLLLLCVLVPWTAINLVDYYAIKHGDYDIDSLFARDGGIYGRFNKIALFCYFLGIAVQIPFLHTPLYTGPLATLIGDVDISWLVGLLVISPLYWALMRSTRTSVPEAPRTVVTPAVAGD